MKGASAILMNFIYSNNCYFYAFIKYSKRGNNWSENLNINKYIDYISKEKRIRSK